MDWNARLDPWLTPVYDALSLLLPEDGAMTFVARGLLALLLLAPACAALGVQVVNARQAYMADAVSHSAFAGVALAAILGRGLPWLPLEPRATLLAFAALFGLALTFLKRRTGLSSDVATGVTMSLVVALGLALVGLVPDSGASPSAFLFGSMLTLDNVDVAWTAALALAAAGFMLAAGNRLLVVGLEERLAAAHGVRSGLYAYLFSALLALAVMTAARMVGVLLVTALLVVPAAAGRNLARSWRGQFWWTLAAAVTASFAGLRLSLAPALNVATGALVVLCAGAWFVASLPFVARR